MALIATRNSVMLVASLTNSGVKNQVPHFLFKTADGDLVLVSSYEVADILLCDSLYISESLATVPVLLYH